MSKMATLQALEDRLGALQMRKLWHVQNGNLQALERLRELLHDA